MLLNVSCRYNITTVLQLQWILWIWIHYICIKRSTEKGIIIQPTQEDFNSFQTQSQHLSNSTTKHGVHCCCHCSSWCSVTTAEAFPRFNPIAGQFNHPRVEQFDHPHAQQFDHARVQQEEQFNHPRVQQEQFDHPRVQSNELATTQDISIERCGSEGELVNNILQASLGWLFAIFPNSANIAINCDYYGDGRCTAVTVQAPVGTIQADVDVCVNPGNTSLLKFSSIFKSSYINSLFDPTT